MIVPLSPETYIKYRLQQGQKVQLEQHPGVQFVVTRLGAVTEDELAVVPAEEIRRGWRS